MNEYKRVEGVEPLHGCFGVVFNDVNMTVVDGESPMTLHSAS